MRITWDPKKKDEIDLAEKIHRHATDPTKVGASGKWSGPKATAFKEKRGGKQGDELTRFDPKAGSLILVFP